MRDMMRGSHWGVSGNSAGWHETIEERYFKHLMLWAWVGIMGWNYGSFTPIIPHPHVPVLGDALLLAMQTDVPEVGEVTALVG